MITKEQVQELLEAIKGSSENDPILQAQVAMVALEEWPWALKTAEDVGIDPGRAWELYVETVILAIESPDE